MTNKKIKKRQDCIIKQVLQFGIYIEQMEREKDEDMLELCSVYEDMLEYIKEDYDDGVPVYKKFIKRINTIKDRIKSRKTCGVE